MHAQRRQALAVDLRRLRLCLRVVLQHDVEERLQDVRHDAALADDARAGVDDVDDDLGRRVARRDLQRRVRQHRAAKLQHLLQEGIEHGHGGLCELCDDAHGLGRHALVVRLHALLRHRHHRHHQGLERQHVLLRRQPRHEAAHGAQRHEPHGRLCVCEACFEHAPHAVEVLRDEAPHRLRHVVEQQHRRLAQRGVGVLRRAAHEVQQLGPLAGGHEVLGHGGDDGGDGASHQALRLHGQPLQQRSLHLLARLGRHARPVPVHTLAQEQAAHLPDGPVVAAREQLHERGRAQRAREAGLDERLGRAHRLRVRHQHALHRRLKLAGVHRGRHGALFVGPLPHVA
mmetsp:Transcript_24167/g.83907  ORF Transcript_24167/g.83907 Transcript_24167/m.83907 type:complete len:343 (+) Transcript_24167:2573-3601(+)